MIVFKHQNEDDEIRVCFPRRGIKHWIIDVYYVTIRDMDQYKFDTRGEADHFFKLLLEHYSENSYDAVQTIEERDYRGIGFGS